MACKALSALLAVLLVGEVLAQVTRLAVWVQSAPPSSLAELQSFGRLEFPVLSDVVTKSSSDRGNRSYSCLARGRYRHVSLPFMRC